MGSIGLVTRTPDRSAPLRAGHYPAAASSAERSSPGDVFMGLPPVMATTGFAELMADLAVSFSRGQLSRQPPVLVEQIVAGAVMVIPGVRAAAVVTVTPDGVLAAPLMRGDEVARTVLNAHNTAGQGPSFDSWRDDKQLVVDDVAADVRWPAFSALVANLPVRSLLCTPITVTGERAGVLTLIGDAIDFDDAGEDTAMLARVFAAHAGIAMTGERRAHDATAALSTRDVIGQAKGIVMERLGVTADAAFAMLVKASADTNTKLRTVCDSLCLTGMLRPPPPR